MKKFVSLLLALMLIMALGSVAFADGETTGTITVSNATVGETYAVYKLFDLTYSGDKVAYTFTKTTANEALFNFLNATGSPFTFEQVNNTAVYNILSTADAATIAQWMKSSLENAKKAEPTTTVAALLGTAASTMIASNDTVKFENLDFGYYYVDSSLGANVTLDKTIPTATVIDKNQNGPSDINKKIIVDSEATEDELKYATENSVNFDDVVPFEISFTATNYVGTEQIQAYRVVDILPTGMTWDNDVIVKVDGTVLAESAYTVTRDTTNTQKYTIEIPWVGSYSNSVAVVVTYSAKITDAAAMAGVGSDNLVNSATVGYTTDPNKEPWTESEPVITTSYTFALALLKVDEKGNALADATFAVTDAEGNEVKVTETTNPGVYNYTPSAENATNEVTSPASGKIVIKGVAAGTYTFTETQQPKGYNLLTTPVTVTASMDSKTTYTSTITKYYDADGNLVNTVEESDTNKNKTENFDITASSIIVINRSGTVLPSTGGIGTTIFYIVGGLLVVGAAVLIVTKKRTGTAEE